MLWNGLDFFSFETTELDRQKGEPDACCDKLRNIQFLSIMLLYLILFVVIVGGEISQYDTQKSVIINLKEYSEYAFNAREHLTLVVVHYFFVAETVQRARTW